MQDYTDEKFELKSVSEASVSSFKHEPVEEQKVSKIIKV